MNTLHPVSHTRSTISMRPVSIPTDLPLIHQWANVQSDSLAGFYESIEGSDFIESWMICNQGQPVWQVDICKAQYDELSSWYTMTECDYTLRFLMPPGCLPEVLQEGLYQCLHYCFNSRRANRVIIPGIPKNPHLPTLLANNNFSVLATGVMFRNAPRAYSITKEAFQRRLPIRN